MHLGRLRGAGGSSEAKPEGSFWVEVLVRFIRPLVPLKHPRALGNAQALTLSVRGSWRPFLDAPVK